MGKEEAIPLIGLPQALAALAEVAVVGKSAGEAAEFALGTEVAGTARAIVAVDTGETRESIQVTPEGVVAEGAALYLEFGTYKMAAQPFMRPAADGADVGTAITAASLAFRVF